jgi:hypothetical protein
VESSEREEGEKAAGAISRALDLEYLSAQSLAEGDFAQRIYFPSLLLYPCRQQVTTVKQVKVKG